MTINTGNLDKYGKKRLNVGYFAEQTMDIRKHAISLAGQIHLEIHLSVDIY